MATPEYSKAEGFDISLEEIIDKGVMVKGEAMENFNEQARNSRDNRDAMDKVIDFLKNPSKRNEGVLDLEKEPYVLVRVEFQEQEVSVKDASNDGKPKYQYQKGGHLYNIAPGGENYRPINELLIPGGKNFELAMPGLQRPLVYSPSYYVHIYAVPMSCFPKEMLQEKGWVY